MILVINGERKNIDGESITLDTLLEVERVSMPDMVTVQLNGVYVKKEAYPETQLREDDAVDFLYFMGGGARR